MSKKITGRTIRHKRRLHEISQAELAKSLSVTQGYINQVENGTNTSLSRLISIKTALDKLIAVKLSHSLSVDCKDSD